MAWAAKERKPVRRSFRGLSEARAWRQAAQRRRQMNAPSSMLLSDAAEGWLSAVQAGVVRTRSGEPYKPSAIRSYDASLRRFVLPELGALKLSAVTRPRVQDLVDRLVASGLAPSTVANAVLPLRAIYRRAVDREEVVINPTLKLALPRDHRRRDRIAEPREVAALLEALPDRYRVLWATAIYAGLRRGELQALRWGEVELKAGVLRVVKSWDRVAGLVEPKSRSGYRKVPIPAILRSELVAHRLRQGSGGRGFVFSVGADEPPFDPSNALRAARRVWAEGRLRPLGFHEARHTYASLMIAAGVNAKALCTYMGHSSITVTLDRYGHLMPGNEREAAELLDGYLDRALAPVGALGVLR
jgi:integrase